MKKVIKIKDTSGLKTECPLYIKILTDNFTVKNVDQDEDLLIHSVHMGEFRSNKKVFIISGEPLF